jgi:hypothetical protein
MFSFLTLDQSTLFYWTLSDVPPKRVSAINDWASAIPTHSKSTFQGPKSTSGSTSRTKAIPSLTASGGPSRSSATSILTDNIRVFSHPSADQVKIKAEQQAEVISLSDEGGLSDSNELGGNERELAINSPIKGKKRITSEVKVRFSIDYKSNLKIIAFQQLVSLKSSKAPSEPAPKKPRNEELPQWIEAQWFRHTFVTTYMAFVGQTMNPWDVPVKQSIMVMQKIWDATSNFEYVVTTDTAVYHKVRDLLGCRMILIHISDCSTARRLLAQCHWFHRHCSTSSISRLPT